MPTEISLLEDGLVILCVGFFVVFAFLTVLIFAMGIMHIVVEYLNKIFPIVQSVPVPVKSASSSNDDEIAVAIAACIAQGR